MNKKRTVLMVDDDAIRNCLKEYFELEGFLVTELINGFTVETYLKSIKPDNLSLDIFMPDKDGIDTLLDLKNAGINIIALSRDSGYLDFAVKLGIKAALLIPIDLPYLKELIRIEKPKILINQEVGALAPIATLSSFYESSQIFKSRSSQI